MTRLNTGKGIPGAADHKTSSSWKSTVLYTVLACALVPLAGLLLIAVLQMFIKDSSDVLQLQSVASLLHAWGLAIQCAAVAVIVASWKHLVAWAAARGIVQPFERERALAFRGKAAVFMLLYLLLIPIGPYRIWSLFAGIAG